MKQEAFVPGAAVGSTYVHEKVELNINLSRGTELIRLGTASLVISGEEEGEILINVPAKAFVHKSKNMNKKKFKKGKAIKSNKYGYFANDLTRRYSLEENATLRVGIRVIPQDTLDIAEAREKKENDIRKMLQANQMRPTWEVRHESFRKAHADRYNHFQVPNMAPFSQRAPQQPQSPPKSLFPDIFCGAMLCAPGQRHDGNKRDVPFEVIHMNNQFNELGIGSMISSVSESTDGSDYSDSEIEAQIDNYRRASGFQIY